MWLWPIYRFWTFTPLQFVVACYWNICELIGRPTYGSAWCFSTITGLKGKRIT
jgi:hypothetical protein